MSWYRKVGWIVVIALVVLAVAWGLAPRPILVDTAVVDRGVFEVTVREEGRTRVVERYVISAPVPAYARRVELDVGDAVGEGEVLLRLEPMRSQVLDPRARAEAEARVAAADAALRAAREEADAAQADAQFAAAERERIAALFERGAVSSNQRDAAESAAQGTAARSEAARRAADVAEYDLEAARTALRYSAAEDAGNGSTETVAVRSPIDGQVLRVLHESEGAVGTGEPLLEVGNPGLLEVEVEVLSADAVKITPGTAVRFERWGGEGALDGVVRVVEPVGFTKVSALGVEEQRVLVIADIVSPPQMWERLGDQYRVDAVFILSRGDDVLQIPSSALFQQGEAWAVFVVENGRARLREVQIGRRSGLDAEVTGGLQEGETVVVHPDESLEDGSAVSLVGR